VRAPEGSELRSIEVRVWAGGTTSGDPVAAAGVTKGFDAPMRIGPLEPGDAIVAVRALGMRGTAFADVSRAITIPREGDAEASIDLVPAGLLHASARAPDGRPLAARIRVRDAKRRVVADPFADGLGERARGIDDVFVRALPPGRYEVEASAEGFVPDVREVFVPLGQTADAALTLRPIR
jgi:hypothetical protein